MMKEETVSPLFALLVEFGVEGVEVPAVQFLLDDPQAFTETGRLK